MDGPLSQVLNKPLPTASAYILYQLKSSNYALVCSFHRNYTVQFKCGIEIIYFSS